MCSFYSYVQLEKPLNCSHIGPDRKFWGISSLQKYILMYNSVTKIWIVSDFYRILGGFREVSLYK